MLVYAFRPSARRSYHALLFDKLHADDQSRAAAMVASMTGGVSASAALHRAASAFTVISFSDLTAGDFKASDDAQHTAMPALSRSLAKGMPAPAVTTSSTPVAMAASESVVAPAGAPRTLRVPFG